MSPTNDPTVSVLVAVNPMTAFEVFTEEVDVWWKRGPAYRFGKGLSGVLRFEPGVGGRLVEEFDDGRSWEVGHVRAWEPGERLVFEFRIPNFGPDQFTEVEVRFEPEGDETRVTLQHRGWECVPPGHPARHGLADLEFAHMRGEWWLFQLRAMRSCAGRHKSKNEP